MNDLISRKALCDYALNQKDKSVTPNDIMRFPSAQPEQRWIPCSERMPEEHDWIGTKKLGTTISDEVYVTFENPRGSNFCKHLSFQNGKLSAFDKSTIDAFYKGSKPIAWMPLPEPYRGERTEE